MSENQTLKIHAHIAPEMTEPINDTPEPREPGKTAPRRRTRRRGPRPELTRGDRLLRNSAVACAMLLGVLALGNVDAPWARVASERIEHALTMRIDLDESIGALTFVKDIMPESALVFLNVSGDTALGRPVEGAVSHGWSHLQPWMMFDCPDGASVRASAAGTVTAVSPMSGGRYGVLVDHGDGIETLYASLSRADVSNGDSVDRGQALGTAGGSCYFEYRSGGQSIDPTEALGL